jgi:dihydrofolate synthase/folylpolyglutamate synthase
MAKKVLEDWLEWIKNNHSVQIDLSLERVLTVARRLDLDFSACPVVTVGGTNGKGSCVAGLESIYLASGYRVGTFTSPFLFRYNEQVKVQGISVSDDRLCEAFDEIAKKTDDVTLTPFEWTTLAAFFIFKSSELDVWILEVGLGGRYDAVNILNADVAIIASISMDHMEWLGNTREAIAYEKAGIFRKNKPAICGDLNPPASLLNEKVEKLYSQNKDFGFENQLQCWKWWSEKKVFENLPLSSLALQNMSCVLMAVELLQKKLPVSLSAIKKGVKNVSLPGRIQIVPGEVTTIYDVSHNPASAGMLADFLRKHFCKGKTRAVFSMLKDKDILSTLNVIKDCFDSWNIAPLCVERGAEENLLMQNFHKAEINNIKMHSSIKEAFNFAKCIAEKEDRIVVFGSFHTVASVYESQKS